MGKTEKYLEMLPTVIVVTVVLLGLIGFWFVFSLNSNDDLRREETQKKCDR